MIFILCSVLLIVNYYLLSKFNLFAKKNKIIAVGNNKNLHKGVIARGAGIVFGSFYILLIALMFLNSYMNSSFFLLILLGSISCLVLGFLDDLYDLRVLVKLSFQILIILLIIFYLSDSLFDIYNFAYNFLVIFFISLFCVWALNAYNFMDGADGHLCTLAFMQCTLLNFALFLHNNFMLILPIMSLSLVLLIFLRFNWEPAEIFMGDAGSLFIGINFIIFTMIILKFDILSPFLVIIIFSYYLTDTLGTLIIRTFMNLSWKQRHRSHPYQNFSRIYSHSMMSKYVILIHLIWLLPLLIISVFFPKYDMVLCLISLIPSIIFQIKYGPMYSST